MHAALSKKLRHRAIARSDEERARGAGIIERDRRARWRPGRAGSPPETCFGTPRGARAAWDGQFRRCVVTDLISAASPPFLQRFLFRPDLSVVPPQTSQKDSIRVHTKTSLKTFLRECIGRS